MIDPKNITNYNLTHDELEEHILFWVCAAGKNGVTAAKSLENFKCRIQTNNPQSSLFQTIRHIDFDQMQSTMRDSGIGCFRIKSRTFKTLADSGLNLKTCGVEDLESIKGIGPKTARCFLIHSRPNQKLAGLDRHILSFLRDRDYDVPLNTPTGKKYRQIEKIFVAEAEKRGKTVAEFDLQVWNHYRTKDGRKNGSKNL